MNDAWKVVDGAKIVTTDGNETEIAVVSGDPASPVTNARADLIAVSPIMYQVLRNCAPYLAERGIKRDDEAWALYTQCLHAIGRADAVAKKMRAEAKP